MEPEQKKRELPYEQLITFCWLVDRSVHGVRASGPGLRGADQPFRWHGSGRKRIQRQSRSFDDGKNERFFSRYLVLFFCGSWFFFIFFCVGRSPVVKDVDKNETTAVRRELTSVTQFLRSIKNSIRPSAWKNCDSLA